MNAPNLLAVTPLAGFLAGLVACSSPAAGGVPPASPAAVVSHRADISLDPLSRVYRCLDTLAIVYAPGDDDSAFIRLHPAHAPDLFTVDGAERPFRREAGKLWWGRRSRDSVAELVVAYRGRFDFPSEYSRLEADRAVLRAEEILPWGDGPLRSGRLSVTVPAEWEVVGPGSRREPSPPPEPSAGTRVFEWGEPIASIGWICAGIYETTEGGSGGRTISVRRIPGDTLRDDGRARAMIALCDSLLEFYGRVFSPYRFDRLEVVEVDDWIAGRSVLAIAAPSFVMVKRTAFTTDDPYNRAETILPHEVAHQWWMGSVFPEPRAVALLSEGLCEYSSILYGEHSGRAGSRDTLAKNPLLGPLVSKVRRGTAVPLDTAVDIRAVLTQYLKGAYVHHMLRRRLGDAPFLRLLRSFASAFAGRSAGIPDYRAAAEREAGAGLGWFFDQWVSGTGLPALRVYNVRSTRAAEGWTVSGRLRVAGYERYTATVTIEARTGGLPSRTTATVGLDSSGGYRNDVPFAIACRDEPSSVVADPDGDLLLLRRLPVKLSDLRDPGDALMVVGTGPWGGHYRALAAHDSARLVAEGWEVRILGDDAVTLGDLQRDRLILYGRRDDNRIAADLPEWFPLTVRGDSAVIAGETVRDSALGLLQAARNPWLDDGIVVWVQSFSPAARPELRPHDRSWALVRGRAEIHSGTWVVVDEGLEVPVRPRP